MTELAWTRARVFERAWVVGWWMAGRLIVFVTAAIVDILGPRGYTGASERTHAFGLLGSWDGRWYRTVAENGYLRMPGRQSDPAFFPLFPMLLRAVHSLGVGYTTAGILLSNLSFLVALFLFESLTREMLGSGVAHRATVLLAIFPLSFVFSLAYPESIVLALIAGAALAARRDRWELTAILLAGATLARPEALFVALALLPLAWRRRTGAALGAILAPFAALTSFAAYLWWTIGDPLGWTHAERAWGRHFQPLGIVTAIEGIPHQFASNPGVARDIACFLAYAIWLAVAWRRGVPRAWVLAGAAVVVLPTFSGSFYSIGRFGLLAPVVFWGAALAVRGSWAYVVSATLLVAGVVTLPLAFP